MKGSPETGRGGMGAAEKGEGERGGPGQGSEGSREKLRLLGG